MTKEQFIDQVGLVQKPLRRFLHGLCGGDAFRADDLAQEALLKAFLSFNKYQGRAKFSTWIFRIAYNCYFDQCRGRGYADSVQVESVRNDVADDSSPDLKFRHQQLYLAISNLSDVEKSVVLLFYMEEKSLKEIEIIMDMPLGTVKSHLARARKHLKEFLDGRDI